MLRGRAGKPAHWLALARVWVGAHGVASEAYALRSPCRCPLEIMKQTTATDGATIFSDDGLTTRIERLAPGVILGTSVGTSNQSVDAAVLSVLEREIAKCGTITVFFDGRRMKYMSSGSKDVAGQWGKKFKGRVELHVLIKSKVLEMALSILSMVVGTTVHFYSNELAFVRAVAKVVPRFRSLPTLEAQERNLSTGTG